VVAAEARERGDAADGGDLDDVTRTLLAEDREDGLGDVEDAEQARLELVAERGVTVAPGVFASPGRTVVSRGLRLLEQGTTGHF
jgi:hypothetical protein